MKIDTTVDPDTGVVRVVMECHAGADRDRMADLAFAAVDRAMERAQRDAGTIPAGLRP